MAYYFMVEKKKGQYLPLDITKATCFSKKSNYNKEAACSLKEIDIFTTQFFDIQELRTKLIYDRILPLELANKPLSIRLFKSGKYNKVMYDFLYQKDIEYLANSQKLINDIEERYYQNDFQFIKEFAAHFQDYHVCKTTAPEIRNFAERSLNTGIKYRYLNIRDSEGNLPITRLVKLLIYKHYQRQDGKIIYKDELNYSVFHHVIAFINNYDKKLEEAKNLEKKDQMAFDEINPQLNEEQSKPKTKTRKKDPIEGQISLFEEE